MKIETTINREKKELTIKPGETLFDVLRREGCFGVKFGCGTGECGACAVLLDGKAVNSCMMFAAQAHGREIITIEGLGTIEKPHPLQQSFARVGAVQCGYCTGGMIISAKALLDENPQPTEEEVRETLAGHLCRCTGYIKPIKAILETAAEMGGKKNA